MASSKPSPSTAIAPADEPLRPAATMAAIKAALTTRLAPYMPAKSRSCCRRVTQRAASSAAGSASALQTIACAASGCMASGTPAANQRATGARRSSRRRPVTYPPASSGIATRRCRMRTWARVCPAQAGNST